MEEIERYLGSFVGMAVGDALGTTLEFTSSNMGLPKESWHKEIIGGGPFRLLPGQWTDDTSLALCLAESLIECNGEYNPVDQLERYLRWFEHGHMSANGKCFDIGITTRHALNTFKSRKKKDPNNIDTNSSTDESRSGNGSLMRLCPAPLAYLNDPLVAIERAGDSSLTTHGSKICVDSCRYFAGLLVGAVNGVSKDELLSPYYFPVKESKESFFKCIHPKILSIIEGRYKKLNPPAIKGKGYVVDSLEAALWAFYKTNSFEEGLILVCNLGDDADTTSAIYGQLAGAFYGNSAIPDRWKEKLFFRPMIEIFATQIYRLSKKLKPDDSYHAIQKRMSLMESGYREILKKMVPSANRYKSYALLEDDICSLKKKYDELNSIEASPQMHIVVWEDFEKIIQTDRRRLLEVENLPNN